ncbi:YARHG domain-containing protein [Fulvivirga lutea]|uniref:YARHG domain-containing protein n=1 Tax=Fulvivirga lutea TaxID=2810512 RepID=A0A974WMU4_9BACT|nr:YARHG domain-containing protein [Fulvivirga lutea]QSE99185.1 YARHG domain-containing protein [Fulvivirga lutea]
MEYFKLVIVISLSLLFGCNANESKKSETDTTKQSQSSVTEKKEPVSLLTTYQDQIKESFFHYFRKEMYGLGSYNLIKYESIEINNDQVEYTLVTIPYSEIEDFVIAYENGILEASLFSASSFKITDTNSQNDTIIYKGSISVLDTISNNAEGSISSIKIGFTGNYSGSKIGRNPYEEPGRIFYEDQFTTGLWVNPDEPRMYNRDEMFLKARIFKLTKEELNGYSKDDLAYLRNEIFARHGHFFKTDKMKNYFANKEWYKPYVNDATEFLNETEKDNTLFIKNLEQNI